MAEESSEIQQVIPEPQTPKDTNLVIKEGQPRKEKIAGIVVREMTYDEWYKYLNALREKGVDVYEVKTNQSKLIKYRDEETAYVTTGVASCSGGVVILKNGDCVLFHFFEGSKKINVLVSRLGRYAIGGIRGGACDRYRVVFENDDPNRPKFLSIDPSKRMYEPLGLTYLEPPESMEVRVACFNILYNPKGPSGKEICWSYKLSPPSEETLGGGMSVDEYQKAYKRQQIEIARKQLLDRLQIESNASRKGK